MGGASSTPNRLLTEARRLLPSPSGSGRPLSRQELADAVNAYLWTAFQVSATVDATYVGTLELGRYRWPNARRREAFRHVLQVRTDAEIGFFITRGWTAAPANTVDGWDSPAVATTSPDRADGNVYRRTALKPLALGAVAVTAPTALAGLVTVLTTYVQTTPADHTLELTELARQVAKVREAYQQCRYHDALRPLPHLISTLDDATANAPDEAHTVRLSTMKAETYQVASALLLKADEPALAALAADRSATSAARSGNPLAIASSMRAVVHSLLSGGQPERARLVSVEAAERLTRDTTASSTDILSVFGALLLRGAIAAAQNEDRQHAAALLDEAGEAADRIGQDGNAYWTAFGPTNVLLHRVSAAMHLGDAGTAVHLASTVDIRKVPLPERKASLMLDMARALTQWGKYDRALDAIRSAERYAPEEVRSRTSVHRMINDLARRAPGPVQRQVHRYAETIGVRA